MMPGFDLEAVERRGPMWLIRHAFYISYRRWWDERTGSVADDRAGTNQMQRGTGMSHRYGPQGLALSEVRDVSVDPLVSDLCAHIEALEDRDEQKRVVIEKGVKLLRHVYGSKDAFAYAAKEWLKEAEANR